MAGAQKIKAHGELELRIAAATLQIESTPNSARLFLARAELHREHLDWPAATADYDRAAQLDPALVEVEIGRARMLADSGELKASRALFDKIAERSALEGEVFIGRARVLLQLNQRPEAIADFQRGIGLLRTPLPEHFLELAQALAAEGKNEEALRALDKGMKKCGPLVSLQELALKLERETKNYGPAIERIDAIIQQTDRKENWFAERGDLLLNAGQPAAAQKSFREALAAIDALPTRLQQGPAMQTLRARIHAALGRIATPANQLQ